MYLPSIIPWKTNGKQQRECCRLARHRDTDRAALRFAGLPRRRFATGSKVARNWYLSDPCPITTSVVPCFSGLPPPLSLSLSLPFPLFYEIFKDSFVFRRRRIIESGAPRWTSPRTQRSARRFSCPSLGRTERVTCIALLVKSRTFSNGSGVRSSRMRESGIRGTSSLELFRTRGAHSHREFGNSDYTCCLKCTFYAIQEMCVLFSKGFTASPLSLQYNITHTHPHTYTLSPSFLSVCVRVCHLFYFSICTRKSNEPKLHCKCRRLFVTCAIDEQKAIPPAQTEVPRGKGSKE